MKLLLLISCSNRKSKVPGTIPALKRYDGGTYRVIRKMQRNNLFPQDVEVKIISARFGLIDATTLIPLYDLRMNAQRAEHLRSDVQKRLKEILTKELYFEIYVDLGTDYLTTLEGFAVQSEARMLIANGRIGERLHKLKEWLSSHSIIDEHSKRSATSAIYP